MSHFAVLVLTEEKPDEDALQKILLPWHERECTGLDDFCEWIDETEDLKEEYAKQTEERWKAPDGTLHSRFNEEGNYSDKFYRVATLEDFLGKVEERWINADGSIAAVFGQLKDGLSGGQGEASGDDRYIWRIFSPPDGYEKTEVPTSETETLEEFAEGWAGAKPIPGKPGRLGRFTNPNKKWDWWSIGGRYSGRFQAKPGKSGVQGTSRGVFEKSPLPAEQYDQIRLGDMDRAAMLAQRTKEYTGYYADAKADYVKRNPGSDLSMEQAIVKWGKVLNKLRELWEAMDEKTRPPFYKSIDETPGARELRGALGHYASELFSEPIPEEVSLNLYLEKNVTTPLSSYAIVKDGKWYERGQMGWWGMASNEDDADVWMAKLGELLKDLPEDYWLSMVDCHI